jgi:hypothetical protein
MSVVVVVHWTERSHKCVLLVWGQDRLRLRLGDQTDWGDSNSIDAVPRCNFRSAATASTFHVNATAHHSRPNSRCGLALCDALTAG